MSNSISENPYKVTLIFPKEKGVKGTNKEDYWIKDYYHDYILFQGKNKHKRKIRIVFRQHIANFYLSDTLLDKAGNIADQQGWKTAVIEKSTESESALFVFNLTNYSPWCRSDSGIFLSKIDTKEEIEYEIHNLTSTTKGTEKTHLKDDGLHGFAR